MEGVLLSLSELEPPSEAEDAHDAYAGSVGNLTAVVADIVEGLGDVTTAEDLTALQKESGPEADAASTAMEEDCLVLQALADGSGSGANLGCTEQD